MDDPRFEVELMRRFAEPVPYEDAPEFASRLDRRLRRGSAFRSLVLVAAGSAGAVIAAAQVLVSGIFHEAAEDLVAAALGAREALERLYGSRMPALPELPVGGEVFWLAMGVAALVAALLVGRRRTDM